MTFEEFLVKNVNNGAIDFSLRVDKTVSICDCGQGHPKFYIHASGKDSDTLDFVVFGNALVPSNPDGNPL
jgi:hypothetical protein